MIILAAALLSVQSPAPSPRPSAKDEQLFCVFNDLDKEALAEMGELIVDNRQSSLHDIGEIAAGAVDKCQKKWKWSTEQRAIGAFAAAARAAIQIYEGSLKERFSHSQLQALFNQLNDEEKQGLTIIGYSRLDAGERYKQSQRLDAIIFKQNNVRDTDYFSMRDLFFAVARYQEMQEAWADLNQKR